MNMIYSVFQTFSSREKALVVWIFVLLIFMLSKKEIRSSFFQVLKMMFLSKLAFVFIGTIIYAALISIVLQQVSLWNILLLKDTLFWIVGTAFVLVMGIGKATSESRYFKKLALSVFTLSIMVEFVVNLYTFSFWVEMILIPVFVFIGGMLGIAETDTKYGLVKKILNSILVAFGLFSILYAFAQLMSSFSSFTTLYNLRTFIIGPILSLGYIPFLYLFALVMTYETLFIRIKMFTKKDRGLENYSKWEVFKLCNLNLTKLILFVQQTGGEITQISNKEDINKIIRSFKKSY